MSFAEGLDFVALCYEFPPWLLAGAIWTEKLLVGLRDRGWRFEVITAAPAGSLSGVPVHHVQNNGGPAWLSLLDAAELFKLRDWVLWPDVAIYWNDPAVRFTRDLILRKKPRMIVSFMMPYGAGMAGERIKAVTGLPLVYCFSDSQSCTDMNPYFPSWFHYRRARRLEDRYIRAAKTRSCMCPSSTPTSSGADSRRTSRRSLMWFGSGQRQMSSLQFPTSVRTPTVR